MASSLLKALVLIFFCTQSALAQEEAPVFSGDAINIEQKIELAKFKGKVVFLDFWASWCPPCLLSLPAYEQMRARLNSDEFEIIAINVDEDTSNGRRFLEDHPVSYPVLADPTGAIGKPYGIRSLPRSFLLNREGRIVASYRSFKPGDEVQLMQAIQTLLTQ